MTTPTHPISESNQDLAVLSLAAENAALTKKVDELEAALNGLLDSCGARQRYHALEYANAVDEAERVTARTALNDTTQCRESKA